MVKSKQIRLAMFLYNANRGSLNAAGIAYYSRLGMRRTKKLLKTLRT